MTIERLREILKSFDEKENIDISKIINKLEEENKTLRKFLWLNHGCEPHCLYGDDGEMQCGCCIIDFKRWDVKKIMKIVERNNFEKYAHEMAKKMKE